MLLKDALKRCSLKDAHLRPLCCAGVADGVESLHVKVMKVKRESPARKAGVNCEMYLKSLALGTSEGQSKFTAPLIIGASLCRKNKDPMNVEESIWRVNQVDDSHCVDIDSLICSVDKILTQAYYVKKRLFLYIYIIVII